MIAFVFYFFPDNEATKPEDVVDTTVAFIEFDKPYVYLEIHLKLFFQGNKLYAPCFYPPPKAEG